MREFPVFVPWRGEHISAVVAAPDGEPRGLVVLSSGPFAPRSHRFQLWAVAAQRLAESGIASVRWDYAGFHDSTGTVTEVTETVPVDQASAVARFALEATGVERLVTAGNCHGAHLSLALGAAMPECVGVLGILPEGAQPGRLSGAIRRAGGRKLAAFLRSRPTLRRLARPVRRFDVRPRRSVTTSLSAALARTPVLFLYDEAHLRSGPTDFTKVEEQLSRLPASSRARFELRVIATWGLDKFRSVQVQDDVLAGLVGWVRGRFEEGPAATPLPPGPMAAAREAIQR